MTGVLCAASPTALHPTLGSPRDGGFLSPTPSCLLNNSAFSSDIDKDRTAGVPEQAGTSKTLPPSPFSKSSPDHTSDLTLETLKPHTPPPVSAVVGDCGPSNTALPSRPKDTALLDTSSVFSSSSSSFPLPLSSSSPASPSLVSSSFQDQAHRPNPVPKALASVCRQNKPDALSLSFPASLNNMLAGREEKGSQPQSQPSSSSASAMSSISSVSMNASTAASSQSLTDALNDLAKSRLTPAANIPTPTTARTYTSTSSADTTSSDVAATILASTLQSPCFYHQRFADAVDIGKVLEEIKNDVSMSHSRLVATATGVREVSKQLQRRPIKRAVRNIMIVTKARDNQLVYLTRELAAWLLRTPRYGSDLGVNVYVDAKLRGSRRFDAAGLLAENPRFQHMLKYWTPDLCWSQPEKFDLVLTLGGDGTVLFTSWLFQRIVPPVLSFSLGSLGFMTTFEFEKYKEHLNRVMGDDGMKINLRMRFTCTVHRSKRGSGALGAPQLEESEQFEVLNELVIDRGPSPYVSNLELYGDDELLTVVQADGCIFSTPTGSTAYSLSAGGALVHPDIPAILLTPICPHTLSFRPMVLSDTMALRVSVPRNSRATAYCAFDGKGRLELRQGDHVTITASQYPFPTVTRTDTEWFDSVSRTLRWNVRAAAQKPFDAEAAENDNDDDDIGWDIDTDSACYASEEGSVSASPIRRQMSLLGL
ncbi:nad+ kinase [Fusarium albosuccineum]|uniref:Nad+ kinase n=1 Tax=Fusarium albosuccineum TaxID=1237068 RepID=A0A8H4LIN4_9HYPO|nr:nad+ kinase [Fusarium albosuccineum]